MSKHGENLLSSAYHEAGHAVIASVLGLKVSEANICPTTDGTFSFSGGVLVSSGNDARDAEARIVASYAGAMSEQRAGYDPGLGQYADQIDTDREIAQHVLRQHEVSGDVNSLDDLPTYEQIEIAEQIGERLQQRASELVEQHWAAIERVANALVHHRRLTGDAIWALINEKHCRDLKDICKPFTNVKDRGTGTLGRKKSTGRPKGSRPL